MDFAEFKSLQQNFLDNHVLTKDKLFVVDTNKDELWDLYLNSFSADANGIYRERREFDCACCKQFIRAFGNVVAIENGRTISIWDFDAKGTIYEPVLATLSAFVKKAKIRDVFVTKEKAFGTDFNLEQLDDKSVTRWEHFRVNLPSKFVLTGNKSPETVMSNLRAVKDVFKRSLNEISKDSVDTVLELINQNSLYKGEEWKAALTQFRSLQTEFDTVTANKQDNYCWAKSVEVGGAIGKIKNHSIGVLLTDISKGMDLNTAVKRYEKIVAPSNYKRPKAIFTKKMIEQAQKKIEELGFMESLGRRYASLDDIKVNNILFANRDSKKVITGNIFDELKSEAKVSSKKFDKVEKVPVETFVKDILPTVKEMEILVSNKHQSNFTSLIAPKKSDSKTMFKWNNNFSWAYNGNITDSMKERVKSAGGKVDGVLRFSIQWNDELDNQNDFDAHCIEPSRNRIYFSSPRNNVTGGNLDVDIRRPGNKVAVENITWPSLDKMKEGVYKFSVHNYAHNGGRKGFSAEIEYGGEIYSFDYDKELRQDETIQVATIDFNKANGIKFIESLPSTTSSRKVWGVDTEQFQPVTVCMHSPNHWDQQGVGNKHYFFMLGGCKNDEQPNGFFNEFLNEELMEHKRVFEALGSKMKVDNTDNQLSGLGFSSTQRNSLICKLKGKFTRMVEITF